MTEKRYDVTIGIPVYNVEGYIRKSLLSALDQTFGGTMEILIIDDGVTDGTMNIVRQLRESHARGEAIRVVQLPENQGVGHARNTIISQARGKYLFFLDSDDYISPDCIEKLYQKAEQCKAEVVYGSVITVNADGNQIDIGCSYLQQPDRQFSRPDELASYAFQNLHENLRNYCWNTLFATEFISRHQLRFPDTRFHEDVIFSTDMVPLVERGVLMSDTTYFYVIREHSLSHLQGRTCITLEEIKEFISIYTYVKNKNKALRGKPYYEARCARSLTQMLYIVSGVLKNRRVISPALPTQLIKEAMVHPAPLKEILRFRKYRTANLAFYSLGVMPSWLTIIIIKIIAKYKHLL